MVQAQGNPGDILETNFTVENVGTASGEQVIELIRTDTGGVVDSKAISLSAGQTAQELLEWDTSGVPTDTRYTIQVESVNDAASFDVELGSVIPDSGISRWTLDDTDTDTGTTTAIDVWGNNDADYVGATTGVSGYQNEAYSLDGTDDYMDTTVLGTDLPSTEFTILLRFNPDNWNNGDFAGLVAATGTNDNFFLTQSNEGGIIWRTNDGSEQGIKNAVSVGFTNGTWHSIAARYSSTNGYKLDAGVAGNSLSSFTSSDTGLGQPDEELFMGMINRGGSPGGGGDAVPGDYDDLRFYSKYLSDTEVSNWNTTGTISG